MDYYNPPTETVTGSDLKVGDTLMVWGSMRRRIVVLTPYAGPLAYLFTKGAMIAGFAEPEPSSITIDCGDRYSRVA